MASPYPGSLDSFTAKTDNVDDVAAADVNELQSAITAIETELGAHTAGQVVLGGVISPTSIGANQNDYNPTGLSGAAMVRLTASGAYDITGLAGGVSKRIVILHNVGSNTITLKDESASSAAANRFALTADLALAADAVAILQYDGTSSRWRAISAGGGGGVTFNDAEGDPANVGTTADGTSAYAARRDHVHAIADGGIATAKLAANAVTQAGSVNIGTGDITTTSTSYTDLTGVTVTITTTGGDVLVFFSCAVNCTVTSTQWFKIVMDTTNGPILSRISDTTPKRTLALVGRFAAPSAGSHTFKVQWYTNGGTATVYADGAAATAQLVVVELKK